MAPQASLVAFGGTGPRSAVAAAVLGSSNAAPGAAGGGKPPLAPIASLASPPGSGLGAGAAAPQQQAALAGVDVKALLAPVTKLPGGAAAGAGSATASAAASAALVSSSAGAGGGRAPTAAEVALSLKLTGTGSSTSAATLKAVSFDTTIALGLAPIIANEALKGGDEGAANLEALLTLTDQKTGKPPDVDAAVARVTQAHMTDSGRSVRTELAEDGTLRIFKKGVFKLPNGDVYTGETVNEKRHGAGQYQFANGDSYVGAFENGLFHGYGVMAKAPFRESRRDCVGRLYQGMWERGFRHGKGRFKSGFGDFYDGDFADDLYDGPGSMHFADGARYKGTWGRGRFQGQVSLLSRASTRARSVQVLSAHARWQLTSHNHVPAH